MADELQLERDLFGSSSSSGGEQREGEQESIDSDDDDDDGNSSSFELLRGPRLPEGLGLIRRALDGDTSKALFESLRESLGDKTQAFFFGKDSLPRWALALSDAARSLLAGSWPRELIDRVPLFDMAAVNLYSSPSEAQGEGRASDDDSLRQHVDLSRFSDGVAVFSLGTPAVMRFEEVVAASESESGSEGVANVLLRDGDMMAMRGEARWTWTHGFPGGDHRFRGDKVVRRGGARIGVTLRRMEKEGG